MEVDNIVNIDFSKKRDLIFMKLGDEYSPEEIALYENEEFIETWAERYMYIKRFDGKYISCEERFFFRWLVNCTEIDYIFTDYEELEEKTKKKKEIIRRMLKNFKNSFTTKFHNVIIVDGEKKYNRLTITPTHELSKIIADSFKTFKEKAAYLKGGTQLIKISIIPTEWRIFNSYENKPLRDNAIKILWTIISLLENNNLNELITDYSFLINQFDHYNPFTYLRELSTVKIIKFQKINSTKGRAQFKIALCKEAIDTLDLINFYNKIVRGCNDTSN